MHNSKVRAEKDLEDESILEGRIGEGVGEHKHCGQHNAPHKDDAVRLRQLHELGDLKPGDVVDGEQCTQSLQRTEPSLSSSTLKFPIDLHKARE